MNNNEITINKGSSLFVIFLNLFGLANQSNIYIKLSGFHYVSQKSWDFPYSDTLWIVRKLYQYYGSERLCWASDYPPVRLHMTYQQSLEVVRKHCTFIPENDMELILGKNLQRLLKK